MGNRALKSIVALKFNGQSVSLDDVLTRLKLSGDLKNALREACRELAILEAAAADGVKPTAAEISRAQADLFKEMGAADAKKAAVILKDAGLALEDLDAYAATDATAEKFKRKLVKDRADGHFKEHWEDYEWVEFSEIAVASLSLAREVAAQIEEGESTFESLAEEHSIAKESRAKKGYAGKQIRSDLPVEVRAPIFGAAPGRVVGPIKVDKQFYLVRVEAIHKAKLDARTRDAIENRLFEEWLEARVAKSSIELTILKE